MMERSALDERIHADQLTGIGSSDAAAILGVSPWSSAFKVWERLTGVETEHPPVQLHWRLGQELEGFLAKLYMGETGRKVRRDSGHHRHRAHPWMVTHLDFRVLKESRLLECKTAAWKTSSWGEPGSAEIPVHYFCQVQHEMAVMGAEVCDVPVLFGFREFAVYTIPRDSLFISKLIEAEAELWHRVETGEPPPLDGSEDARRFLNRRNPSDDGLILPATPEQEELVDRLRRGLVNIEQATESVGLVRNKLIEIIGGAAGLRGSDFEITYKSTKEGKPKTNDAAVATMRRKIIEAVPEEEALKALETLGARLPEAPLSDQLDALAGMFIVPGKASYRQWHFKDERSSEE